MINNCSIKLPKFSAIAFKPFGADVHNVRISSSKMALAQKMKMWFMIKYLFFLKDWRKIGILIHESKIIRSNHGKAIWNTNLNLQVQSDP